MKPIAIDRRTFLRHVTATVSLLMSQSAILKAAPPTRKMTIDLTCGNIGVRANQSEAMELARRFGFESVAVDSGSVSSLSEDKLQSLQLELKEKRLVWGAAGLPVDFKGADAAFAKGIGNLPAMARRLQKAGVTRVGTWLTPGHAELTYVQNFKLHTTRLRKIGEVLAGHGLRLGLEYVGPKTSWTRHRFPFVHTMPEMKELLTEIGLSNVGFILDSWHWYAAGETVADVLSLTNQQVVAVDLNDAPAGVPVDEQMDGRRELPCATGVIDLAGFLNALNKIGFDGPVRAEPFNKTLNDLNNDDACARTIEAMKRAFELIR